MTALSSSVPADTRESLIEAALSCFAAHGYEATSIRLIAAAAGKNSSLISYYFKSKEGLYREVFKEVLARLPSEPPGPDESQAVDARSRLRMLVRRFLRGVEAHLQSTNPLTESAARLLLNEIHAPKAEVEDLLRERMGPWVRELRASIRAIRPDFAASEVDFWGITIHGCCIGHALRCGINTLVWTSADPLLPQEEMADRLAEFAYHGLFCWQRP